MVLDITDKHSTARSFVFIQSQHVYVQLTNNYWINDWRKISQSCKYRFFSWIIKQEDTENKFGCQIFKFQYLILIFWFYFFKDILRTSHFKQPQEPQNRKKTNCNVLLQIIFVIDFIFLTRTTHDYTTWLHCHNTKQLASTHTSEWRHNIASMQRPTGSTKHVESGH